MLLYCGIDLHSNNHVVCVIDDKDHRLLEKKLNNDAELHREIYLGGIYSSSYTVAISKY